MLKKIKNSNLITISLFFLILSSFSFLAYWEKKQHKIEDGWFLYFNNIEDRSADFSIENYSKDESFRWELIANDQIIKDESLRVLNKETKNVIIDEQLNWKKLKIRIYHSKDSKEIYKNFE